MVISHCFVAMLFCHFSSLFFWFWTEISVLLLRSWTWQKDLALICSCFFSSLWLCWRWALSWDKAQLSVSGMLIGKRSKWQRDIILFVNDWCLTGRNKMAQQTIWQNTCKSCMLTANCCVCLRSGWGTLAQLEAHAVSRCVVCSSDSTFCVSVCQLVLVCLGCDRKLPTLSAGANDL